MVHKCWGGAQVLGWCTDVGVVHRCWGFGGFAGHCRDGVGMNMKRDVENIENI